MSPVEGRLSQAGMSLIELMVVAAIMGTLAVGLSQFIERQFKANRAIELRASGRDLADDIMAILSSRASCTATLKGENPNDFKLSVVKADQDGNGTNVVDRYRVGEQYGGLKIELESITLRTDPAQSVPLISANQQGSAILTLSFKLGDSVVGGSLFQLNRRITVQTDVAGVIQFCSASLLDSQTAAYVCETLGGTWDKDGRAGVGDCQNLSLNGNLTVTGDMAVTRNMAVTGISTFGNPANPDSVSSTFVSPARFNRVSTFRNQLDLEPGVGINLQ